MIGISGKMIIQIGIGIIHDPSTMPGLGVEVGEWRDKLVNKNPGWGEVLKKA